MRTHEQGEPDTMVETNIPSFEVFRQEIKKIYPAGNLLKTYDRIVLLVENERSFADGTPITYRLIMKTFSAHIQAWNMQYGEREAKYIGRDAEEKRKSLWDFIGLKWYEREFGASSGQRERNKYLFGDFSIDYLKQRLVEFKRRIDDETSKE